MQREDGSKTAPQHFAAQRLPRTRRPARLLRANQHFVQPRFAPIRGIAMNDPAFGRFVDGRYGPANLIDTGRRRGADSSL
jgi:hypothetical protein